MIDEYYVGVKMIPSDRFNADLMVALLNMDNQIGVDVDFVYYNSLNRTLPFDENKYKNKNIWKQSTATMSKDGSVILHQEFPFEEEDIYLLSDSDLLQINLNKVDESIEKIALCFCLYEEGHSLDEIEELEVVFYEDNIYNFFDKHKIKINSRGHRFLVMGFLQRVKEGKWEYVYDDTTYLSVSQYIDTIC